VQESGAGAMLVMNDDGDAIRMPKGNTPASIGIPSAMLSSTDAEALEALMRSNAAAGMTLSGRMLADVRRGGRGAGARRDCVCVFVCVRSDSLMCGCLTQ
jgi:hypothetical protein